MEYSEYLHKKSFIRELEVQLAGNITAESQKVYGRLRDKLVKQIHDHKLHELHDRINTKGSIERRMKRYQTADGWVYGIESGMDCDCSAWRTVIKIRPTLQAYDKYMDDLYSNAEGQCGMCLIPWQDARDFEPEHRDLAMEAHEDGHDHIVSWGAYGY